MYIQVRLLKGYAEPLLYSVPAHWQIQPTIGSFVRVPIRRQRCAAIVEQVYENKPNVSFTIRDACEIEPFPNDPTYQKFISLLARYHQIDPLALIKRSRSFLKEKKRETKPYEQPEKQSSQNKTAILTDEQHAVYDFITPKITDPVYTPTLLHGVTGSGKTEVYKKLIEYAHTQAKTSLLLLPEVTLALQFERLLRATLSPTIPIFSFHSATGATAKKQLWQALLDEKPILIIGVHLPLLLPLPKLGLIIVDEEHEVGYQEKKHPKINTKDAAILKAYQANIPIVLGSATPTLSSLHNIKERSWHFFQIKKRFAGAFPTVQVVQLNDKKERKNFWISTPLLDALKKCLEKKEQSIIFLNRRGYCFFLQCGTCSFVFMCNNCSVSLTPHADGWLRCHYCDYALQYPTACSACKKSASHFIKKGLGTQQLVEILQKLLPNARIARADMDTTSKKKSWHETVKEFDTGAIDILVGTQTITKGYHFPNVTLVGVIWADLNLNFPLFNASETTVQQLIQVAGRAGRQRTGSEVIVQTTTDHFIFNYLNEIDYLDYCEQEARMREECGYPPYQKIALVEMYSSSEKIVEHEAHTLVNQLKKLNTATIILGPAKPPVSKIKNSYMRTILIKATKIEYIINLFEQIDKKSYRSSVHFVPNPIT